MRTGQIAALWGLAGFSLLILFALLRLTPMAIEALAMPLSVIQWLVLVANVAFMAYSEGYRGFQKSFTPKMVDRLNRLEREGSMTERLLAPLFCMGYFNSSPRQMIVTYSLTVMIIGFVVLFQYIAQPWRGVLDAGVVVGLVWGLIVTWSASLRQWPRASELSESPQRSN